MILHKFVTRLDVEDRPEGLFVGEARIAADPSGRLTFETLDAVEAAITPAGSNQPVAISHQARLLWCRRCSAPFIAHRSARLCSPCGPPAKREAWRRGSAKRGEKRAERRKGLKLACLQCGARIEGAARITRAYCSNTCRQSAYRGRQSL